MDKYLKDLKNAVDSISAECDLTERAVSKIRNNKRTADSSELNFSSENSGDNERFINTDIKMKGKRRVLPFVTAACLTAGMVSLPFILAGNSSDKILPGDEILVPVYTEGLADDDMNPEKIPDFDLMEVKTFSDYKGLSGAAYTAGKLDIYLESEYYNFAVLAYMEPGADSNTYVEFITSSDIPDEYVQKSGGSVSGGISDFYVTDEGNIYYCGWLKTSDKYTKDGIIGKYNQNSGKTEFLKIFDDKLFDVIKVTESGEIIAGNDNSICYQLDSKAETIIRTEDVSEWPGAFVVESDSPYYSQYGHDFNGRSYLLMDFMTKSCSKLCRMDLNTGEAKIIYTTDEICTSRYGNIYSLYSFEHANGYYLTSYGKYSFPALLRTESVGNGHLESCDINLITGTFDYNLEKYRYSVYSPEGEKLYDFDLDDRCRILGNISSESGEKIYCISGDESKVLCYEPETNQTIEMTTLNDNFDISELNRSFDYAADDWYIFMTKSAEYDFLIWNQKYLYGYNINSDELTMITDTLDYYGLKIIRIAVDDDGKIYLAADGSNTLYSLVPRFCGLQKSN